MMKPSHGKVPLSRKFHVVAGKAKAAFLPPGVALVVHKPGHAAYTGVISKVYSTHGVTSVHSRDRPFTKRKVKAAYHQVFTTKPDLEPEVMKTFSSHGLFDRNINVELVHVPNATVRRLGAKNARHAMKMLAGNRDPAKAKAIDESSGVITIRGEAQRQHDAGIVKKKPDLTSNVVHVPDHELSVQDGWPTGFEPDLHVFVSAGDIIRARSNVRKLKREKRIAD